MNNEIDAGDIVIVVREINKNSGDVLPTGTKIRVNSVGEIVIEGTVFETNERVTNIPKSHVEKDDDGGV